METLHLSLALILITGIPLSEGFFPQPVPELSQGSLSHRDITDRGISRAIAKYLREYVLDSQAQVVSDTETIQHFYGSDDESYKTFLQYVKDIVNSGNEYQENYFKDAYRHFNGEQFEIGNAKLMQIKRNLVDLVSSSKTVSYDLVRQRIGEYLYSLQAFYSNTNWVEMYGTARNPDLGSWMIFLLSTILRLKDAIYPQELTLNKANVTNTETPILDQNIKIVNGEIHTSLYDKRHDFGFNIVNFPWHDGDVPRLPSYGTRPFSIKTADSKTKACDDCKDVNWDCKNNIVVSDVLTSGYRWDQDVSKPYHNFKYKCSHGGHLDKSRWFRARGGINKDSYLEKYSPHFYLHKEAADAAINATDDFTANGLLSLLGHNHFRYVFNLKTKSHAWKPSLTFAIDVSGSMGWVIDTVIDVTVGAVSGRINSQNEPADYVLSTFNDPESLTTGYSTTNGYSMIQQLQSLKVDGGGDCPEFAISGLLKAVELSQPNSRVYLFTDASAKDANRVSELIKKARDKNIGIYVLLWGSCGGRRHNRNRRDSSLPKVDTYVFDQIANETGGVIHNSTVDDLPSITEDALEDSLPSALVLIDYFEMKLTDSDERRFYVESNLTTLRIQAIGPLSETEGTLIKPDGSVVDFTTGNATRLFILSKGLFMTILNPEAGLWKVRRVIKRAWSQVNVTTQSLLSYSFEVLDIEDELFPKLVKGNLLQGKQYKLLVTMTRVSSATNVTGVSFRNEGNQHEVMLPLKDVSNSETERRFQTFFVANKSITTVVLNGYDESGMVFQRATPSSLMVVNIFLKVQKILDSVVIGKAVNLSYTLENSGSTQEILVSRFVLNGNSIDQTTELEAGENITKYFEFVAPVVASIVTYKVQVWRQSASSEILQEISGILEVSSKTRATCSIIDMEGECSREAMNSLNCSKVHWKIRYDIKVGDVDIDRIFMSNNGPLTNMTVDTGNKASVTGDCCNPYIILNILDKESYLERCSHDFANGRELIVIDTSDDPDNVYLGNPSTGSTVWIIVGVVSVVGVVIAATVFLMIRKKLFAPKIKEEKNFNAKKKFDPSSLKLDKLSRK